MDEAMDKLVGTTELSGLMYVGLYSYSFLQARQEHLACFFPGVHLISTHAQWSDVCRHVWLSLTSRIQDLGSRANMLRQ